MPNCIIKICGHRGSNGHIIYKFPKDESIKKNGSKYLSRKILNIRIHKHHTYVNVISMKKFVQRINK